MTIIMNNQITLLQSNSYRAASKALMNELFPFRRDMNQTSDM